SVAMKTRSISSCTRPAAHTLAFTTAFVLALAPAFATVAAQEAASPGTPPRSATLGGTAIIANQGSASATIVDVASRGTKSVDVGTGPHEAVISPDGRRGVVTIYGDRTPGNRLAIVDLASGSLVR